MLIYEKIVNSVRHLFGTFSNVPADTDVQLTYKDENDETITPTLNDSYVDDGNHGIIRVSDDKHIRAFIGDVNVVPGNEE